MARNGTHSLSNRNITIAKPDNAYFSAAEKQVASGLAIAK